MVKQVRLSIRWTIFEAWRRVTCCDSTARVTLRRTRDPPGVPVHINAQPLTPIVFQRSV